MMRLRKQLRDRFLRVFRQALLSDEGRAAAADALPVSWRPPGGIQERIETADSPYEGLGEAGQSRRRAGASPVLVTGRFRSGTTVMWNIFRHLPGCTAYYEPFNERRWFDQAARGSTVDATHRGVSDYWREYDGLGHLAGLYDEDWTRHGLYMDEHVWNPRMKRFIETLIDEAPGTPVLQFNRLDFRLPWVRWHFPDARIVHIYRHPRDQWCSTFLKTRPFPPDGDVRQFAAHDEFYLLAWARDLRAVFPFLDLRQVRHPYQLFYYLWKLSYLFGRQYADVSLGLEDLVEGPRAALQRLFGVLKMRPDNLDELCSLVQRPRTGKWRSYAEHDWFVRHEADCEQVLAQFFGGHSPGAAPPSGAADGAVLPVNDSAAKLETGGGA